MRLDPDRHRSYPTFEDAVRDQRARHGLRGLGQRVPRDPMPNPLFTTTAVYGASPATCPECRPNHRCPFHRSH